MNSDTHFSDSGTARLRASLLEKVRTFFRERDILEVDTPLLSRGISTDRHIDVFSTPFYPTGYRGGGGEECTYYLQTSPEFFMKRLLSDGYPDIFQICKVFRNGERGRLHNPEFTMLEWYRKNFTIDNLMDEVADLCFAVVGSFAVRRKTYRELFSEARCPDPLECSCEDLNRFCASRDSHPPSFTAIADALDYCMSNFVEPLMPRDTFLFVDHFPATQAMLAALDARDPRTAHRFELYCNGVELCNGYEELADWRENLARQEEENRMRADMGKPQLTIDTAFIDALKNGLPRCSGVALGLDRLIMLAAGSNKIDDVLTFPWECS